MPEITTYFGPPGTGKTRALLDRVRDELSRGVEPERIALVAFTRRAAAEARARGAEELGLDEDAMRWWRTLHSTAARELGVRGGELVVGEHWDVLGEALGMRFSDLDEAGRPAPYARRRGRRAQSEYYLRRARGASTDWPSLVGDLGPALARDVARFARTLEAYKREFGLLDYSDLIHSAPGSVVRARVVLVDEAQDLTPAQWSYARRLWARAERVYVAGDDEQAIFGWAGADVRSFLALPGDRVVLDRSYRLPRAAYDVARAVSAKIVVKQPKRWSPSDRLGSFVRGARATNLALDDGTWLLLSRTRHGRRDWEALCRRVGVRFVSAGEDSVRNDEVRCIVAWERARAGRTDYVDEDLEAAYALSDGPRGENVPIWREALVGIPKDRRLYYETCLRRDRRALYEPARVRIDTVHGAKGAEADHVAVAPDTTPRIERAAARDPDAEHRVWYVAVTRCRDRLVMTRPTGELEYAF